MFQLKSKPAVPTPAKKPVLPQPASDPAQPTSPTNSGATQLSPNQKTPTDEPNAPWMEEAQLKRLAHLMYVLILFLILSSDAFVPPFVYFGVPGAALTDWINGDHFAY